MILILAETVYTKNFFFLYFLPPCILPPPHPGLLPHSPFPTPDPGNEYPTQALSASGRESVTIQSSWDTTAARVSTTKK